MSHTESPEVRVRCMLHDDFFDTPHKKGGQDPSSHMKRDKPRPSCRWLKSAAVVLLVLPLPTGYAFTTCIPVSNTALHMTTASAQSSTSSGMRDGSQSFWDKPQLGVPERFLQRIKEEPWRGALEPCIDHPLTEINVDGEVPQALEGTLFRNGKRPRATRLKSIRFLAR